MNIRLITRCGAERTVWWDTYSPPPVIKVPLYSPRPEWHKPVDYHEVLEIEIRIFEYTGERVGSRHSGFPIYREVKV